MAMQIEALYNKVDIDLQVVDFWKLSESLKQGVLTDVLKMPASFKPTLDRNIQDVYSKGARADWVKRLYPVLVPVDMTVTEVADYLGTDIGAPSRAKNHGILTTEHLTMLLDLKADSESLPRPPRGATFLAGMAHVVPWTQNIVDQLRDPGARLYRAQDDLKYQEVKYLETLVDEANLQPWLLGIAEAHDDRRALSCNPRIRRVLTSCLLAARASLSRKLNDEAPCAFDLSSPEQTHRFCNHLVNLWNRTQAGWILAHEAVRNRMSISQIGAVASL